MTVNVPVDNCEKVGLRVGDRPRDGGSRQQGPARRLDRDAEELEPPLQAQPRQDEDRRHPRARRGRPEPRPARSREGPLDGREADVREGEEDPRLGAHVREGPHEDDAHAWLEEVLANPPRASGPRRSRRRPPPRPPERGSAAPHAAGEHVARASTGAGSVRREGRQPRPGPSWSPRAGRAARRRPAQGLCRARRPAAARGEPRAARRAPTGSTRSSSPPRPAGRSRRSSSPRSSSRRRSRPSSPVARRARNRFAAALAEVPARGARRARPRCRPPARRRRRDRARARRAREGSDGRRSGAPGRRHRQACRARLVVETLDRDGLVAVQTPQAFVADRLRAAFGGELAGATDCASLVEARGGTRRASWPATPARSRLRRPTTSSSDPGCSTRRRERCRRSASRVVFDVGETLVDEERYWRESPIASGSPPHVVWAALGKTIERGEEHWELWRHLGIARPPPGTASCTTRTISIRMRSTASRACVRPGCAWGSRATRTATGAAGRVGGRCPSTSSRVREPGCPQAGSGVLPAARRVSRALSPREIAYVGDRARQRRRGPRAPAGLVAVHLRRGPWGLPAGDPRGRTRGRVAGRGPDGSASLGCPGRGCTWRATCSRERAAHRSRRRRSRVRRGRAARARRRHARPPAGARRTLGRRRVAHALTDALLGAAGLADIGALFPSDDERYRGADSLILLADAYRYVRRGRLCARQRRLRRDRPGAEDRPASRGDAQAACRSPRRRARARQRPRDDNRPARVHWARRGARRPGRRAPQRPGLSEGLGPIGGYTVTVRRAMVGGDSPFETEGLMLEQSPPD